MELALLVILVGFVLSVVISWGKNESILWACFHGSLGWLYVVYHVFTRAKK